MAAPLSGCRHPIAAARGLLAPFQGLLAFTPLPMLASPPLGGGLGAGGRGCSYLPLEQGRKLKLKDSEKAELRWKHKVLLSPHRNLRETVAKRWLFVGGKSERVSHSVLSDSVTPWM